MAPCREHLFTRIGNGRQTTVDFHRHRDIENAGSTRPIRRRLHNGFRTEAAKRWRTGLRSVGKRYPRADTDGPGNRQTSSSWRSSCIESVVRPVGEVGGGAGAIRKRIEIQWCSKRLVRDRPCGSKTSRNSLGYASVDRPFFFFLSSFTYPRRIDKQPPCITHAHAHAYICIRARSSPDGRQPVFWTGIERENTDQAKKKTYALGNLRTDTNAR